MRMSCCILAAKNSKTINMVTACCTCGWFSCAEIKTTTFKSFFRSALSLFYLPLLYFAGSVTERMFCWSFNSKEGLLKYPSPLYFCFLYRLLSAYKENKKQWWGVFYVPSIHANDSVAIMHTLMSLP